MVRAFAILLAALTATAASAQTYSLADLGALPGSTGSEGHGINDLGEVVGLCNYTDGTISGFVWRNGALTNIGALSSRTSYTMAHAINTAGTVVGEGDAGDFKPQAVIYRNGKLVNLDPNNGANVRAIFVATNGSIVGDIAKGSSGNVSAWSPTIWTEDSKGRFRSVALLPYPGGDPKARYAYANGANNRLQVVGGLQNTLFGGRGAFWNNDANHTLAVLQPLPGKSGCYAQSLNDLGQAVGVSYGGASSPVLWAADAAHTPTALPLLPGDLDGGAVAINDAGDVIGGSGGHPVLWRNRLPIDLQTVLDATADGYTLTAVAKINNRGQIVGTATRAGISHAVILIPTS